MRTLIISAINLTPPVTIDQAAIVSFKASSESIYGGEASVLITSDGSLVDSVFYDVTEDVTYNVKVQLNCGSEYIQDIFIPIAP